MKNKNFLKKLTAGILGFVMTLGVGAAGYAGAVSETRAAALGSGYTKITSISSLSAGDKVVLYCDDQSLGVTGQSGSDATVSSTEADWVQYDVEVSSGNYYFKDAGANKYIASPGSNNKFVYGTKAACSVNENGVLVVNNRYLVKNSSYYRMYTSIGSYKPFFVYKVGSGGGQTSTTTLNLDPTNEADQGETTVVKNPITVTMTTMNQGSYYQIYANQSMTVSSSAGKITKIEFVCTVSGTAKYGPGNASANTGNYKYSGSTGTWTGSASSVTISSTAQVRMTSLSITYETSGASHTHSTTNGLHESQAATCTEPGHLAYYECTATESPCGKYFIDAAATQEIGDSTALATWLAGDGKIPALGHNFEYSEHVDPSCETEGYDLYVCSRCKAEERRDVVPASHSYVKGDTIAPTCTEQGYTIYECSLCHDKKHDDFTNPTGHKWGSATVIDATCTEGGHSEHTCETCGETESFNYTDALGHDWSSWTSDNDNTHKHICNRCSEEESENHSWDEGEITTPATEDHEGIITYTCDVCGRTKTETFEYVPAPGSTKGNRYVLVTDDSTLSAGDFIVLCYQKDTTISINTTKGSNSYLGSTSATITDGILTSDGGAEILLSGSAATGWKLSTSDCEGIAPNGNKNIKNDASATWSISISSTDNKATIRDAADAGNLQYNASAPRFTYYTSAQVKPYIYKKIVLSSIEVKTSPKVTYTEGNTFDPTGLVINEVMSTGDKTEVAYADHASDFTFTPNLTTELTTSNTSIEIKYKGKKTNLSITVNEAGKPAISLDKASYQGLGNSSTTLTASVENLDGTVSYTWTTGNTSVVKLGNSTESSITNNSKTMTINLLGAAESSTTVTVTASNGNKSTEIPATCSVTVTASSHSLVLKDSEDNDINTSETILLGRGTNFIVKPIATATGVYSASDISITTTNLTASSYTVTSGSTVTLSSSQSGSASATFTTTNGDSVTLNFSVVRALDGYYKLMKKGETIADGDNIIIGDATENPSPDSSVGFISEQNNANNRKIAYNSVVDGQTYIEKGTGENYSPMQFTVESASDGKFKLRANNYETTSGRSSNLYLQTAVAEKTLKIAEYWEGYSDWSVSIGDDNIASVTAVSGGSKNLKRNSTSALFNVYASGQEPVYLYKQIDTVLVDSLTISSTKTISVTEPWTPTVSVSPETATEQSYDLSVESGSQYVQLSDDKQSITGIAKGTATIKATAKDGSGTTSNICTVTVQENAVTGIEVKSFTGTKSYSLNDNFNPNGLTITVNKNYGFEDVVYSESNKNLFSFDPTTFTSSVTKVKVTYAGFSADIEGITVDTSVHTSSVEIKYNGESVPDKELNVSLDASISFTAVKTPAEAVDDVSWSSSDESIATVANGAVTLLTMGDVDITATSNNHHDTVTLHIGMPTDAYVSNIKLNASDDYIKDYYLGEDEILDPEHFSVTATYSSPTIDGWSTTVDNFEGAALNLRKNRANPVIEATYNNGTKILTSTKTIIVHDEKRPLLVTFDLTIDQTNTATTDEISWLDANTGVSIVVSKNESSTSCINYYPGTTGKSYTSTRVYGGMLMEFDINDSYSIDYIEFACTSETYKNAFMSSTVNGAVVTATGNIVKINPLKSEFSILLGGTVGFESINVKYLTHSMVETNTTFNLSYDYNREGAVETVVEDTISAKLRFGTVLQEDWVNDYGSNIRFGYVIVNTEDLNGSTIVDDYLDLFDPNDEDWNSIDDIVSWYSSTRISSKTSTEAFSTIGDHKEYGVKLNVTDYAATPVNVVFYIADANGQVIEFGQELVGVMIEDVIDEAGLMTDLNMAALLALYEREETSNE